MDGDVKEKYPPPPPPPPLCFIPLEFVEMQRTVKDARLIFKPCARYLPTPVRTPLTIPYPCSYSGNSVGRNPFEFPLVILSDSSPWITNWIITRDYYDRFVKFEHDSKYYSREFLEFEFFRKRVLFLYFKQSEY